jgi:hypothetical protein
MPRVREEAKITIASFATAMLFDSEDELRAKQLDFGAACAPDAINVLALGHRQDGQLSKLPPSQVYTAHASTGFCDGPATC